jgi:hypothetical protein
MFYGIVRKNGKADSYVILRSKKEVIEKTKLLKLTGAELELVDYSTFRKIREEIVKRDEENRRNYMAIRRDLKFFGNKVKT